MKFLKKHIKIILIFVVSTLIVSMVSVYATYSYLAQDVSYTKSDGTEVSVKDALDELRCCHPWVGLVPQRRRGLALRHALDFRLQL